ncbi:hypothetical protein GCM10010505_50380 [Kitasatospora aburaviensis]
MPAIATCAVAASATQSAAKTTARSERIRSVITMTLIVASGPAGPYRPLRYWPVPSRESMPGRRPARLARPARWAAGS